MFEISITTKHGARYRRYADNAESVGRQVASLTATHGDDLVTMQVKPTDRRRPTLQMA